MRIYEERIQPRTIKVIVDYVCDGCGRSESKVGVLFPVAIEVNFNEEMGSRDEYDYCTDCLIERADILIAAGSKAELVTGNDETK